MSPEREVRMLSLQKVLAITVVFALLLWSLGIPGWVHTAEAAALTNVSDTLSDSGLGDNANHTIQFTTPNGMEDNGTNLTVTFPAGFDISSIDEDDIDIADDGTDLTTGPNCGAAEEVGISTSSQTITFEFCATDGVLVASSSVVTIEIGTNATASGAGSTGIGNPSTANSYAITIGGTIQDSGTAQVVIIEDVTVSAAVDTTMSFSIDAVDEGVTINDEAVATFATTTATTVPFGTLIAGTPRVLGQELTVSTNAPNGYSVTVSADQTLTAGSGADIDAFIDGAETGSSTDWVAPTPVFGTEDSYGHWGITSDDDDVGSTTLSYGASQTYYVGNFIQNPVPVLYHNGPANGTTQGEGITQVGYKIQVSTLQEAGNDYTATLTYVATPVF